MATINSIGNKTGTLVVDSVLTVSAGGAGITGATTINGGTVGLGTDNAANAITVGSGTTARTINVGNSAAAHVVTVGSTNAAAQLALQYGTADFTLASATGTVMSALDTGEVTKPLQPAFLASLTTTVTNVTGDGTFYYNIFDNKVFDQGGDFNLGTSIFTAPVTGRYQFNAGCYLIGLLSAHTDARLSIATSNRMLYITRINPGVADTADGYFALGNSALMDMDAGDIARIAIYAGGGTKVVDMLGHAGCTNHFGGSLVC